MFIEIALAKFYLVKEYPVIGRNVSLMELISISRLHTEHKKIKKKIIGPPGVKAKNSVQTNIKAENSA